MASMTRLSTLRRCTAGPTSSLLPHHHCSSSTATAAAAAAAAAARAAAWRCLSIPTAAAAHLPPRRPARRATCRVPCALLSTSANSTQQQKQHQQLALPPPLLSVAPMMDWTDVHFRQLARLLSRHTWLYTEMVVDQTVLHQQHALDRFLAYPEQQRPVVLQLGGSDPDRLARAVELAAPYSYDEINLNCGCPSETVSGHGCFGARLMLDPQKVGRITAAMASRSSVPVTVKCRIGVDDFDSYDHLAAFVQAVSESSPVKHFIVHARKALLKGLSPAENRTVPPLKYEYVIALLRDFPHLLFSLNGGIVTLEQAATALSWGVHGVMIGRAAYNNPWHILGDADHYIFARHQQTAATTDHAKAASSPSHESTSPSSSSTAVQAQASELECETGHRSRRQVLEAYAEYADACINMYGGGRPNVRTLVKPLLGLFHGERGGARWRRAIDASLCSTKTVSAVLEETLRVLPDEVLDALPPQAPCMTASFLSPPSSSTISIDLPSTTTFAATSLSIDGSKANPASGETSLSPSLYTPDDSSTWLPSSIPSTATKDMALTAVAQSGAVTASSTSLGINFGPVPMPFKGSGPSCVGGSDHRGASESSILLSASGMCT